MPTIKNQSTNAWFLWVVSAITLFLPAYLLRLTVWGIPTTVWEFVLYGVVLVGVYVGQLRLSFFWNNPIRWPLILLTIASVGAVMVSPDIRIALGQWKALFVDSLLYYWLIASVVQSEKALGRVQNGYLIGAGFVALHALVMAGLGVTTPDGRVAGIYVADSGASPNYLALFLAPAAAMSLARAFGWGQRRPDRIAMFLLGTIITLAVIASASRAGIGAVVVAVFMSVLAVCSQNYQRYRRAIWVSGLAVLILGFLVILPSFLPNFTPAPGDVTARLASSNNIRWEIWRTTITTVLPTMSVMGLGWGNYQPVFTELTKTWVNYPEYVAPLALHPHNFFLTTLVTLGYLGLLAWVWILGIAVRNCIRGGYLVYAIPALAALVAWLIQGLPDTTYYKNDLAPLTWLVLLPFLSIGVFRGAGLRRDEKPNISIRKNSISHSRQ